MRVIAGELGGRELVTSAGGRTRPTTARVRRSLFDMLTPVLPGASCLDLFAGSGALGIEAISRGAEHCWFVEADRAALRALRTNLNNLGLRERSRVIPGDVLRIISRLREQHGAPFDLVLADPPYERGLARQTLELAGEQRLVRPGGLLVIQHAPQEELLPGAANLVLSRRVDFGETCLSLYRAEAGPERGGEDRLG
ncbi:MAG: 16S rRNA (guanine(966)-N(2))-methyltransferase RsmD [Limnochordales bacterium]|nr:16S rRNA (guanine(966)-N(2))-methyltransferase RsmD [Limnochordales bacterium]